MEAGPRHSVRGRSSSGQEPGRREPGNAISAAALAICLGIGAILSLAGAVGLAGQSERILVAAFVLGFGVVLPFVALVASRLSTAARDPMSMRAAAMTAGIGVVAVLCLLRLLYVIGLAGDARPVLAIIGGGCIAAGVAIVPKLFDESAGHRLPPWADRLANASSSRHSLLVVGLAGATLLVFLPAQVSPAAVALATIGGVATGLLWRGGFARPRSARLAIGLDLLLLLLVALTIIDVTGYWGQDFAFNASPGVPVEQVGANAQVHQHFYLGAVNDILHGRALLVDASSVYGIGNAYLVAAWFQLAPFGYGPFGLLGSLFTVAVIVLGWGIVRAAGVPRSIAAVVVVVAVMLTVLAPITSPSLYLNVGGFRFAPPFVLLAVALLTCARVGPVTRSPWVLATFAFFSLWSIEAIAYCTVTYFGLLASESIAAQTFRRALIEAVRSLAMLLGASLVAHLLFATATRIFGGAWPDWGSYLSLVEAWSDYVAGVFIGFGEPWSRSWLVGGLYLASAVGAALLLRSGGEAIADRRTALAISGLTATGVAFLSYFVSHSVDVFLPYLVFPALLVSSVWIALAMRQRGGSSLPWGRAALGLGAFAAVLIIAGSWSASEHRFPRTALAHLIPGGPSLVDDLRLMWHSPPVDPRAVPAEELIDRYFPADRALVLVEPDLGQEALQRSGRANVLPISDPWQDEVDLDRSLPPVEDAVAELKAGTLILVQKPPEPGAAPSASLIFERVFGNVPDDGRLGPLAQAALDAIRARFELKSIASGPDGLTVARLRPRASS